MPQDPNFAIQILEKIGAPLTAAVEAVPLEGDNAEAEAAKIIAQMLGQAVQLSIALSDSLDIREAEEQADSTRVALAGLVTPLLAGFYRQNGRVPEDADLQRMRKSLESVLVFAGNFTPAGDAPTRLSTIDHDAPLFDGSQAMLVVLQILTPVINAVAEFPFGLSETKLVQDVSERLQKDAADIAGNSDKLTEMMVLKALAGIYTACHKVETNRLLNASDDARAELSLDPVWEKYETGLAMVKALTGNEGASPATGDSAPAAPVQQEQIQAPPPEKSQESPQEQAPPPQQPSEQSPQAAEPPQQPLPSPPAQPAGGGGPMSFFTKKEGGSTPPAAAPPPPAPQEQAPAQESTQQQAQPPQEPAAPATPEQPPAAPPPPPLLPPQESGGGEQKPQGEPGNPMSFFKGKPKQDDGGGSAA
jgi:hypothetical protein